MKAKGLMTAVLVVCLLLISSNAFANSVKINILVQGSPSGLNATVVEHGPRGVPFDHIDLTANNREHGWDWGTMLHANGQDAARRPASSLHLDAGPASTGTGLTLAVSITADNSAVLFVRDTRVGSTLGIFGPDGPANTTANSAPNSTAASIPTVSVVITGGAADPGVSTVVSAAAVTNASATDIAEIPEPTSLLLLGTGLVSLAG